MWGSSAQGACPRSHNLTMSILTPKEKCFLLLRCNFQDMTFTRCISCSDTIKRCSSHLLCGYQVAQITLLNRVVLSRYRYPIFCHHRSTFSLAFIHSGTLWDWTGLMCHTHTFAKVALNESAIQQFFLENWFLVSWSAQKWGYPLRRSGNLVEEKDTIEVQVEFENQSSSGRQRSSHSSRAGNLH